MSADNKMMPYNEEQQRLMEDLYQKVSKQQTGSSEQEKLKRITDLLEQKVSNMKIFARKTDRYAQGKIDGLNNAIVIIKGYMQ